MCLGEEPLVIHAAKPKFSSPIWIEEIQRNKIFNKQKSVCNEHKDDENDGDSEENNEPAAMPLTNGAIFLTEPLVGGDSGDVTPRRTRVRFPVRSISEILEFEDDDEEESAKTANEAVGVGNGEALDKEATTRNGDGSSSRRFLQTDI